MNNWRYAGIEYDDIVNGIGLGAVFFTQYCPHQCPECQNPQTWSRDGGMEFDDSVLQGLLKYFYDIPYSSRLTISGGDPLASPDLTYYVASNFKSHFPEKKLWLYTGYKFEAIPDNAKSIIPLCDIIVDGKFEIQKRDITLQFKGSSNQRVIDVKESLKQNQVILYEK